MQQNHNGQHFQLKSKSHYSLHFGFTTEARFKRHILHVLNLMQMSENNRFFSFALDSAHVKCDV